MFDALWQEDKTWLDYVEQNGIQKNPLDNRVREIAEFGHTDNGRWYPKVIKTWNPINTDDESRMKKIWLRTDPEFPNGIFDPEALPKTDG